MQWQVALLRNLTGGSVRLKLRADRPRLIAGLSHHQLLKDALDSMQQHTEHLHQGTDLCMISDTGRVTEICILTESTHSCLLEAALLTSKCISIFFRHFMFLSYNQIISVQILIKLKSSCVRVIRDFPLLPWLSCLDLSLIIYPSSLSVFRRSHAQEP